jgi:hypothetical protein
MGKWMLIFGIVLMAFAMVVLFMSISNAPQTTAISQSLVCESGEKYVEVLGSVVRDGTRTLGREFSAFCEGDGTRREVTPQAFALKAAMFVVPFLLGLFLFLIAIFRITTRATRSFIGRAVATSAVVTRPGQSVSRITINGQEVDQMPPEVDQMLKGLFGESFAAQNGGQNRASLTDRLRQLQEARDAGLISRDEYERVRQQILDSLDD